MYPNDLTISSQVFNAVYSDIDKSTLLAPQSFFDACNVADPEEKLRRMQLLHSRAMALGVTQEEFDTRRDNYLSQWNASPTHYLGIARMAARRRSMQELGFAPMSDIEPRKAEYLIEPYLPLDAITILAGAAGMGKTWLALKWAAGISAGTFSADHQPGLVYYFTRENDPNIVLAPRLQLLSANTENIVIMPQIAGAPPLTMNDPRLEDLASRPGCRPSLVVFDPIQSYLGRKVQMNHTDDVRPIMDYLANFAGRHHCAVLLVSHVSKPSMAGGSAADRILGSGDFRNAARSIIFVGTDPDDPQLRVFAHEKNSLGANGPSRRFSITPTGVDIMDECDLTADEILRPKLPPSTLSPARERAEQLLLSVLGTKGWAEFTEIKAAADKQGVKDGTLRAARQDLNLSVQRIGFPPNQRTYWFTPGLPRSALPDTPMHLLSVDNN